MAVKLKRSILKQIMKKILPYLTAGLIYVACNDEKKYSNDEADTRQHDNSTVTTPGAKGSVSNDTTSTSNNSAYNTDSASGQGTTYDTSSNNKK